jgi:hypothetical protein
MTGMDLFDAKLGSRYYRKPAENKNRIRIKLA